MADRIRARVPRGGQQRPRITGVLPRTVELGQSVPLTPPAPPALSRALISNFLAFSFLTCSSSRLRAERRRSHLRSQLALAASPPPQLLHQHPRDSPHPPMLADRTP